MSGYAELAVTSNFSFLRGASHPEEFVAQAAAIGLTGIGIADRNSVAGVVRAHSISRQKSLRLAVGARLVFTDGTPDILAYPADAKAWARLTRLLSLGKQRAGKGDCHLGLADLLDWQQGLNLIVAPSSPTLDAALLPRLYEAAKDRVWLAASHLYRGDDSRRLARLAAASVDARVPLLATNEVHYHHADRRALADVITCIREHTTLDAAGRLLAANAERHLKPAAEMARLFREYPGALEETVHFLQSCNFSLDQLRPSYPLERREGFATPMQALVALAEEGARRRYPDGLPPKIRENLDYEYRLVAELNYAPYFLTVQDIVRFARSEKILCQGRGSAANSTICYCLGVTEVDPMVSGLLFERFLSAERGEPPDIDVDFEHERREEVIQYIYRTYGRERAAMTGVTTCYRGRSAIREVSKVFGLSADVGARLAKTLWGWSNTGVSDETAQKSGLDTADPRLAKALTLARELIDFPRHLSQHVGGFVITEGRLDEIVPIENAAMADRTVIEWNKDDLEALHILKVDVLGLGMLSCLRRAFALIQQHYALSCKVTSELPLEEPQIYRMLSRADTIGVFQVESRAQMSMLPRLKPKEFCDLVIEVAIVRPGPIQGNMVHPYLRRRADPDSVTYPAPHPDHGPPDELKEILHKTLGVPLFQEQAMRIAIVAAKFLPAEADRLRRAMATFRRVGTIESFREKFVNKMVERGYPGEFAANCFSQIEGFGEYGFPESHAASFALLVYASSWIKCRYPDVFTCALLNSQPMGFYAAGQLVRDAQEHGVEARQADINHSDWDCTLEPHHPANAALHERHRDMQGDVRATCALRLGLRQIEGFTKTDAEKITAARLRPFVSIRDLWLRSGIAPAALRRLALADAFGSLGIGRREALWAVRALRRVADKDDLPLLARAMLPSQEVDVRLPVMTLGQEVVEDYTYLRLSLKTHPVALLRSVLESLGVLTNEKFARLLDGSHTRIAGLVLVRQHPGSAKSIFMTLEDETAAANVMVWPKIFEAYRATVMGARLVAVSGRVQSEAGVVHLIAEKLEDLTPLLRGLKIEQEALIHIPGHQTLGHEVEEVMPRGRNFQEVAVATVFPE